MIILVSIPFQATWLLNIMSLPRELKVMIIWVGLTFSTSMLDTTLSIMISQWFLGLDYPCLGRWLRSFMKICHPTQAMLTCYFTLYLMAIWAHSLGLLGRLNEENWIIIHNTFCYLSIFVIYCLFNASH